MARKAMAKDDRIYQIKVTLHGTKPPIWRRLEVRADTPLDRLHEILQLAMGWFGGHLHQFIVGQDYYGPPLDDLEEMQDERKYTLAALAPAPKMKLKYEYDFGDSWEHDIVIEKVVEADSLAVYPRCTAGAGNCPPEDCGGVWGFYEMLEVIRDPKHPEHAERMEWLGRDYDPDAFSLDDVNSQLRPVKKERKSRGIWVFDK